MQVNLTQSEKYLENWRIFGRLAAHYFERFFFSSSSDRFVQFFIKRLFSPECQQNYINFMFQSTSLARFFLCAIKFFTDSSAHCCSIVCIKFHISLFAFTSCEKGKRLDGMRLKCFGFSLRRFSLRDEKVFLDSKEANNSLSAATGFNYSELLALYE